MSGLPDNVNVQIQRVISGEINEQFLSLLQSSLRSSNGQQEPILPFERSERKSENGLN